QVAQIHADEMGLDIKYMGGAAEDIKQKFDVVLALEIVEHVCDVDAFVKNCARLCKPGGMVIFSTLNRTAKSFILGKMAAEYILGWVPAGTHDWKKFLKPSELATPARSAGLSVQNIEGMVFDPITRDFKRHSR